MSNYHEKIARILRADKHTILELESSLEHVTGKAGIFKKLASENEELVKERLSDLGLSPKAKAQEVYDALISKVEADDIKIFEAIGLFTLRDGTAAPRIIDFVSKLHPPKKGFFLKKEKARELLIAEPPQKILKALDYNSVEEMLEKEDLLEVYSALRFLEDSGWLNNVFFKQYEGLGPDDFEEREIELRALNDKWGKAAERFVAKKYHNVSHLKELGIIFVIPIFLGISGETLRLVTLLLHYLNEVEYYSGLFTGFKKDEETFAQNIISALRGDVIDERLAMQLPEARRPKFLVVQRYLAKDDENDWRLFEPHINPEALHWQRAESDLLKMNEIFPRFKNGFGFWIGLGWVGDFFSTDAGVDVLVSFNLVDTTMSLVKQKELIKYLYHHQEALWNKIFIEYFGVDELEAQASKNIIRGWFEV